MARVFIDRLDRPSSRDEQYPMPPCTTVDPDLFTTHGTIAKAKQICMDCPLSIRQNCLRTVMACDEDPGGVYGGLSRADREDLRSRTGQRVR